MDFLRSFINATVMQPGFYLVSPKSIVGEFLIAISYYDFLPPSLRENAFMYYGMNFALIFAGYVAYLVRLMIAIVFVSSFIVRWILMTPTSLIWRRIVESDKPLFTLILGGISAFVEIAVGLSKHLGRLP
jgi:hypothetical protein